MSSDSDAFKANDEPMFASEVGEITIVDAPISIPEEQLTAEPSITEQSHTDQMLRAAGQFACKHASIAGSKEGGCERLGQEVCTSCRLPFCPDHASSIDPLFCSDCLSPQSTEVVKEPLIDSDGITHRGIHITPSQTATAYKSLSRQICEMTDTELYAFIREETVKVRQAEAVKEYHMIARSSAQVEQDFREKETQRRLRGQKLPNGIKSAAKAVSNSVKGSANNLDALKTMMAKMGMTPTAENVLKFAAFLASKKG